mgnify:FL=1
MTVDEIRDKVLALEQRAERIDELAASFDQRLREVERTQSGILEIRILIERLSMSNESVKNSLGEMNGRLDRLEQTLTKRIQQVEQKIDVHEKEPAKKWADAKWILVAALLSGLVGYGLKALLP